MNLPKLKIDREPTALEKEMKRLEKELAKTNVTSDDYRVLTARWVVLDNQRLKDQEIKNSRKVKRDTWVNVGKALGLCLLTLTFEYVSPLTSAAKTMWLRDRDIY